MNIMGKVSSFGLLFVVLLVGQNEANSHTHTRIVSTRTNVVRNNKIENDRFGSSSISSSRSNSYGDSFEFGDNLFADYAAEAILTRLEREPNTNVAKNVIVIVAENMPLSKIRQARKASGQCQPVLFPNKHCLLQTHFNQIALVKTECFDNVEGDSACSATAILTGVKANGGTVGISPEVGHCSDKYENCNDYQLSSIAAWAQAAGKRTGLVTTSHVTSPAVSPLYAHSCNAFWESDADIPFNHGRSRNADIASQLIHSETGQGLNVILGGGRGNFMPNHKGVGFRLDKRNLIREWMRFKRSEGEVAYVETSAELWEVCAHTDYVLGLFSQGKLYSDAPELVDLTEVAIKLLDRPHEKEGFVLFVQQASREEYENEFEEATAQVQDVAQLIDVVNVAEQMTSEKETLIIFTSSYARRSKKNDNLIFDDIFNNFGGPSFDSSPDSSSNFKSYSDLEDFPVVADECDINETGEDAFVFASGPWAHLFSSIIEQYWIPHFVGFAACIGEGAQACDIG